MGSTPIGDAIFFLNAHFVVPNPCKKQATALENFVFPAVAFSFCLCSFFALLQKMGLLTYVWVAVASLRLVGLCPPSTPIGDAILLSPENLPAAAEEPPRRSCFALGGCSRFSGDLALRHSAHLCLAHALRMVVVGFYYSTLPRRSFSGDGSFSFALIYPQPCATIHPPVATNHFERSVTGGAAHGARAFCFSQNKI